jgi:hypothetical protein
MHQIMPGIARLVAPPDGATIPRSATRVQPQGKPLPSGATTIFRQDGTLSCALVSDLHLPALLEALQQAQGATWSGPRAARRSYGKARVRSQLLQVSTRPTRSSMASRIVPVSWK